MTIQSHTELAARELITAYVARFRVPGRGLVGPIDEAVEALAAALESPTPPERQGEAINADEIKLFAHTIEQFEDCNETDTPYETLMKWANRGWLECERFISTAEGNRVLEGIDPPLFAEAAPTLPQKGTPTEYLIRARWPDGIETYLEVRGVYDLGGKVGIDVNAPAGHPLNADASDYDALEREHMGDFEKKTGIYAKPSQQEAPGAPDMRHPKIQALISANARYCIEMRIFEQIIESPTREDFTAMDMEYWGPVHDSLLAALRASTPEVVPLTDEQRKDLLAAALYINSHNDEDAYLRGDDAERIAVLLLDLSGYEPPDDGETTNAS